MDTQERALLQSVVDHVLRQPDHPRDPDIRRAANRLSTWRGDALAVLLEHATALEAALATARAQAVDTVTDGVAAPQCAAVAPVGSESANAAPTAPTAPAPRSRGLLRDVAVVGAGALGAGLVLNALDAWLEDGSEGASDILD